MRRTIIEKLLVFIAWAGLVGGILFGTLISKGILESGQDMCVPQAIFMFVASVSASIAGWALLMQIVNMSDRLRKIEEIVEQL